MLLRMCVQFDFKCQIHTFRYPFARQPGFDFPGGDQPVTLPNYRWVLDMHPSLAASTAAQGETRPTTKVASQAAKANNEIMK